MAVSADHTYSSICHEKGVSECSCESGKTILGESSLAENTANKELRGRVRASIGRAKFGRHEGERFGVPDVTIVDSQHDEVANEETHGLVNLESQRQRRLEGCDLDRM